ncbi:SRPBCC family protein [Parabacteroides faecis]|jgi:hypothetical protein|uniref:SRPBCC family protein n=1 Tax=Parabacteroides faecis TaxID=1217282 RepID=A0ABR6KH53_9BACT|nr:MULTISPECIES: SRPBCC family protein [Parabacteroides]MBB4620217.1 hypothetical protein [Parabacteroides faecis]MBC8617772.1 SRPBCC family protein [Parabacteroides faecis]MCS2891109.1 SRPBCC family protein [Parabacteroides faecis]RHR42165.1 SRPBCC family protein [Parabacteroides sp. AF18-52]RHR96334.1 SRPBCC family protein [Parabacteroides sp. AF14-59]
MMSFFIYFFIVVAGIVALIFIIGLLLPNERTATSECYYNASPEKVYNALTNNADYGYRSDLEEIVIIEENDGIEVWDEIAKNGSVIRFRTAHKKPYSLYEFDIVRGNGFTGHWKGELKATSTGGTHFTSTETIRMKNPFLKVLSRLFFNLEKFMHTYQNDLRVKLSEDIA